MFYALAPALAALCLLFAVTALRSRYGVVVVRGPSMAPTYVSGDRVLIRHLRGAQVRVGDVVLLRVPGEDATAAEDGVLVIKRVVQTGDGSSVPAGSVVVHGDNRRQSVDSRVWGPVNAERLLAKVVRKF
ncbi:hypothetical protein KDL01_01095 [Actinospica durhamensis]|uniref:signal peptidase I n=1 Tax=Actinospica durhamensis TaxID=1508375 RepID=A0A941EMP2_9ACTN|nr:S26 family signal peptidase [Actinospica durhamensis]MBR7831834.1 hypothetical protein [Actinospica durhamensis]